MDAIKIIPINWELAKHPMNWVILFLMITIAVVAADCVLGLKTTSEI